MGRNASDRARATKDGNVQAARKTGIAMVAVSGKSIAQMQATVMAERLFTDMMASAGISSRQMMSEVLYWIPDDFRDMYVAMTVQALKGTDGGVNDRNKAGDQAAAVGRAARKTASTGKKFKKYWVVQDEDLLELKSKMDKRLRAMAREIREVLDQKELIAQAAREWASTEAITNELQRKEAQLRLKQESQLIRRGRKMFICACGILISATWKYCPSCGRYQESLRKVNTR